MKEEMSWKKMEGKLWNDRVRKSKKREGRLTLESKQGGNENKSKRRKGIREMGFEGMRILHTIITTTSTITFTITTTITTKHIKSC